MAAAAILNYHLVTLDHPQSPLVDRKLVFKFGVNQIYSFEGIFDQACRKFGLKRLFGHQKFTF